MQLLYVSTKQGIEKILSILSKITLFGSCVSRIADTLFRELFQREIKRQLVWDNFGKKALERIT